VSCLRIIGKELFFVFTDSSNLLTTNLPIGLSHFVSLEVRQDFSLK